MGMIIALMFTVATVAIGAGLLSDTSVSSVARVADAWKDMEVREGEIARTSLQSVSSAFVDNKTLDYTLKNSGELALADFGAWDLVMQYYDASGNYHVKWLPRTTGALGPDQWKITGIYIDAAGGSSEIYQPNVLDPDEELRIRLSLSTAFGGGTNVVINLASPNGVTLSDSFQFIYLPSDDFESGGLSGGFGWLAPWSSTGNVAVTTQGTPHGGTYHLRMKTSSASIERSANLSGQSNLHLQLWAKVDSFEGGDTVEARVSSNHTDWTTVKTWTSADSDNTYKFVDIDLTPYTMSSEFWIAFNSGMNSGNDFFYVDDLQVVQVE